MKEIGMDVNDYQIQLNLFFIELETFTLSLNVLSPLGLD